MERIEEYEKYVLIMGFKEVEITNINILLVKIRQEAESASVQLFNGEHIAGADHLFFATLNALNGLSRGTNISNSFELEIMLYASGQRQISKAIDMLGVKPSSPRVAIIIVASNPNDVKLAEMKISRLIGGVRDDRVLEIDDEKKALSLIDLFGITKLQLEATKETTTGKALTESIIELGALLATKS